MNIFPDEKEIPFKVLPDKILVNGPGYRFKMDHIFVKVGPALRYRYLFNDAPKPLKGEIILVVLPYWDHLIRDILEIIHDVDWPKPLKIKFHPTVDWKKYKKMIPLKFSVTSESLHELFFSSNMVVGDSTGAIIEAVALGIPVINISKPTSFSHEYLPKTGKGIIWDQAKEAGEVSTLITHFQKILKENPEKLKEEGARLKSLYFAEPTDELIDQAFEL
jgi:hypothetical protein